VEHRADPTRRPEHDMDESAARSIVQQFVKDAGLRRHMLAVAAAMRWYARKLNENESQWAIAGLLHDFDWEIHPTLEDHPAKGAPILRERGVDESIIRAILSHNTAHTGVERERPIDFALLACDEVTGLIIAAALVRPSKSLADLEVKSVKKKWKDRAFAAGVDREHVASAVEEFSVACFGGTLELDAHIGNVIDAMREQAGELELDGRMAQA